FATGAVAGGNGSTVGGLVALNAGTIVQSFATGAVTGGDGSTVAGLVAVNTGFPTGLNATLVALNGPAAVAASGVIRQSYSTGAVTGGANSTVGGLVGDNSGTIDQTYATGRVTGGAGSTLGGLIAVNSGDPGSVTSSYWDKQATGQNASAAGTGLTTPQLSSGLPAGFDPNGRCVTPAPTHPLLLPS